MTPLQKLACPHSERSEPDRDGYAVCLKCGGAIPTVLTRSMLNDQMLKMIQPKIEPR